MRLPEAQTIPHIEALLQAIIAQVDAERAQNAANNIDPGPPWDHLYLVYFHFHEGPQCHEEEEEEEHKGEWELNPECQFRDRKSTCEEVTADMMRDYGGIKPPGGPWYRCYHVHPSLAQPADNLRTMNAIAEQVHGILGSDRGSDRIGGMFQYNYYVEKA